MGPHNELTTLLNIRYPIVQGPFGGGLSSIELLSTVSNAGGLGSYGAHHLSPEEIGPLVANIRLKTSSPFAINLWLSNSDHDENVSRDQFEQYADLFGPIYRRFNLPLPNYVEHYSENPADQVDAAIQAAPPVLSFVFGVPDHEVIDRCKEKNIITIGTATTVSEAIALKKVGIDLVVATGFEAGGHRVSFLKEPEDCLTGTFALIPQVVDQLDIPVIAAGGIADIRGVRAAMALGAQGVQIGTAFLACKESGTSNQHRQILFKKQSEATVLSRAYTGRLARFVENEYIRAIEKTAQLPLPFPLQSFFSKAIKTAATKKNDDEYMSLYAGQAVSLLKHQRAEMLFQSLVTDFL
ncbi:MAG: NAD(P)H-dependent flavin oxidoreductase [Cellvibrionaceae bacterium]